MSRNNHIT